MYVFIWFSVCVFILRFIIVKCKLQIGIMKGKSNHHREVVAAATGRRVGWQCACLVEFDSFRVFETLMGPRKP